MRAGQGAEMWRFEGERIHIDNLRVHCIIGVNASERAREQALILSLSFPADFSRPAQSEVLEQTVDYAAVADVAREFVRGGRFRLLETLARELALHLCQRFDLPGVTLRVCKPAAIDDSDGAAVSLTLTREGR